MSFNAITLALAKSYTDQHSGGGSWDNLKNKPFYEINEDNTVITWDGNIKNGVFVDMSFLLGDNLPEGSIFGCYKVSDLIPTRDELIGNTLSISSDEYGDESIILKDSNFSDISEYITFIKFQNSFSVAIVREAGIVGEGEIELNFSESGIYFFKTSII